MIPTLCIRLSSATPLLDLHCPYSSIDAEMTADIEKEEL
jgi:hypothetical protein